MAKTRDRLVLGRLAQPHPQVDAEVQQDPGAPGPADGVGQPTVGRATPIVDAEGRGDGLLVAAGPRRSGRRASTRARGDIQHAFLLAPEQRQDAMRGQLREAARRTRSSRRTSRPASCWPSRTRATIRPRDHICSRRDPMRSASSAKRSTRMARAPSSAAAASGTPCLGIDVLRGSGLRIRRRIGEQPVGQRLQPGLPSDLRLGPALGLDTAGRGPPTGPWSRPS